MSLDRFEKIEVLKRYRKDGCYFFSSVIPLDLIEEELLEIDYVLSGQWDLYFLDKPYPGKDQAIMDLFYRNANYRRILYNWLSTRMQGPLKMSMHSVVNSICKMLEVKMPIFSSAAHVFHIPGEDHFLTEIHQDIGIMDTDNSITFWYPLIPVNKSNGPLKLFPGSHLEGVIEPYRINFRGHSEIHPDIIAKYDGISYEMLPGDLLVFSTKMLHTATANEANNCRWGSIFRFDDGADNKYFDEEVNPLKKGYIMEKTTDTPSGFTEGDSLEDLEDHDKVKVFKAYEELK